GMGTFIHAAREFGPTEIQFVIGGSPGPFVDYEREIERMARDAGVSVERPGTTGLDFLRSLDVVVVPSRYEGSPLVVLEAMAMGRPIVASDIPGVRHIVGGDGARLAPVDDPAALADEIQILVESEHLRHRLIARARLIVQDRFTRERMVDRVATTI